MFARPVVGPITSRFGPRPPLPDHSGVDFGWLHADPERSKRIVAPADGVVSVGRNDLVGNFVSLAVTPNDVARLCHFASVAVRSGDRVRRGQFLGVMGDTGTQATGVHLHFDYYRFGVRVNPEPYITEPYPGELQFAGLPDEDDMPTPEEYAKAVWEHPLAGFDGAAPTPTGTALRYANRNAALAVERLRTLPADVWAHQIPTFTAGESTSAATMQRFTHRNAARAAELDAAALASLVIASLPVGESFTLEQVQAATRTALEPLFAQVNANIDDQPTEFTISPK